MTERDHFFEEDSDKKKEENIVEDIVNAEVDVLREALEIVAIYAKSLKINNETDIQRGVDENGVTLTPKTDEKTESIDVKIKLNFYIVKGRHELKYAYPLFRRTFNVPKNN